MIINKVSPVSFGNSDFEYERLEKQDITRLPCNISETLTSENLPDRFEKQDDLSQKRSRFFKWTGMLIFAGAALIAAKKYNWFSPLKREIKKISNEPLLLTKSEEFVNNNFNDEALKLTIKTLLEETKGDKKLSLRNVATIEEILGDKFKLDSFIEKSLDKLKDEPADKIKVGFAVDIISRFSEDLRPLIKEVKDSGKKVADEHTNIINKLFEKKASNEPSAVEVRYKDAIKTRIYSVFKEFIFDKL